MFYRFSDHERKLLIDRLKIFNFKPLTLENGVDIVEGLLLASHAVSRCLLVVDLSSGFDVLSGIPDRYLGFVVDEQMFDITPIDHTTEKFLEVVSNISGSTKIEEENLDTFSVEVKSAITSVKKTETHALTKQRVGQHVYREKLIEYWGAKCAVSGVSNLLLLRASHIKPWAICRTDIERMDVYNGILLSANLDAAFDSGLISFDNSGGMMFSSDLSNEDRELILDKGGHSIELHNKSEKYMCYHRNNIFHG
jgi:hypothetical protein